MDKNVFNKAIEQLEAIASRYDIDLLKEACQRIVAVRDSFEMKVLFVGHFSAGKSSFLNELIGRPEFLQEGQNPTTAKVTELRYDENELPGLEELRDYTIVDTPGFDSGVGEHARALATYLGCGGGYVVMSDIRKGDIDDLTLNYINEVSGYTKNVAVVFSWCDQVSEDNRDKVLDAARETLRGRDIPVYGMSRHDKDVAEVLKRIILSFSVQETFQQRMQIAFETEKDVFRKALKIAWRHAEESTWNADRQLSVLQQAKDRVTDTFQVEREAIEKKFPEQVDSVMSDIHSALEDKADLCADIILSQDGQALEAVMLEAVRPVLLRHVKQIAARQIDSIVQALNFSSVMKIEEQQDVVDALMGTVQSTKALIEAGTLGQALSVLQKEDEKVAKKSENANKAYKAITGITAILTDVINPWAEVVIVLLPEIVGLCQALFGASEHEVARDRYLKRVVNVVSAKLYLPVETALRSASMALVDGLAGQCNERLAKFEEEIRQLEENRKTIQMNNVQRRESLLVDMKYVDSVKLLEA